MILIAKNYQYHDVSNVLSRDPLHTIYSRVPSSSLYSLQSYTVYGPRISPPSRYPLQSMYMGATVGSVGGGTWKGVSDNQITDILSGLGIFGKGCL